MLNNNDEEIWKDIFGYEGYYQVSNLGRIKNFKTNKILKPCVSRKYCHISLYKEGKVKIYNISYLVLFSFVGDKKVNEECYYIDGDYFNNKLDNLKWIPKSDNPLRKMSEELKKKLSLSHKNMGLYPPWWLSSRGGGYKKGNIPWNKEKENCFSDETKEKMRTAKLGKKRYCCTEETKEKIRNGNIGKKCSLETRKKQSIIKKIYYQNPENHPSWKGGIARLPYSSEWQDELKEYIRKRDSYKCQMCGMLQEECIQTYNRKFCIHHIDYNKKNCDEKNLISLDTKCHAKTNNKREYWEQYFKNKIFEIYEEKIINYE